MRAVDLTGMEFAEVEKRFWHSLTALTEAPEYGSDIVVSGRRGIRCPSNLPQ